MKTYEAIAKTKSGKLITIATTEANSIEEARSAMSRYLWAIDCENVEIRESAQ